MRLYFHIGQEHLPTPRPLGNHLQTAFHPTATHRYRPKPSLTLSAKQVDNPTFSNQQENTSLYKMPDTHSRLINSHFQQKTQTQTETIIHQNKFSINPFSSYLDKYLPSAPPQQSFHQGGIIFLLSQDKYLLAKTLTSSREKG